MARALLILIGALLSCHHLMLPHSASARILAECDAAKELSRAGIPRTFISTYVCIMKSESKFNTSKVTGPGHKSSFSYGVFQISSDKWCSRYRPGGVCKKRCDDFLNDDIQDDIACAMTIAKEEGFKHWDGWRKNCKNGRLPNVGGCIVRRDVAGADDPPSDWEALSEELPSPGSLVQGLKVVPVNLAMSGELK